MAATAPVVPALKLGQESLEKVLEALRAFFVVARARQERWVLAQARGRLPQQDVLEVIAEESARQAEFERRVVERVRRDASKALLLPEEKRADALRALLRREQVYARQRAEAMAVRALSAVDRVVLRAESPQGAFWRLGVRQTHTPDCVAMAGRFWPWPVLDEFHPPVHAGCGCSLHGLRDALAAGWIKPGDEVVDLAGAFQRMRAARALGDGGGD